MNIPAKKCVFVTEEEMAVSVCILNTLHCKRWHKNRTPTSQEHSVDTNGVMTGLGDVNTHDFWNFIRMNKYYFDKLLRTNVSIKYVAYLIFVLYTPAHNDGLFVRVILSSVVELGFDPRSVNTKDYKHGICCFSAKYATLRSNIKTGWLGIRVMEQCGGTCLPADCCINELAQWKSN